jgi:2-polyprenyl-3-methyl-5-hydroxy-6-metoxy-1,4-benzoquinol methylase
MNRGLRARLKDVFGARSGDAPPQPAGPERDLNTLSPPLSEEEIERLYREQVLTQEFYGDAYVVSLTAFVSAAADDIAESIVRTLRPRRVLDVGCGLGQVVWALRSRGVDAAGCDFSEAFLANAPEEVRPHLHQADVTDLSAFETGAYDLVMCMEVLEHLPERLSRECVRELKRLSRGTVLVTTPSFGRNWPGRYGLPLNVPEWRADALAGRRFANLVLGPDGRPHHGHLTLATYDWWTELFRAEGLERNRDIENAWLEHPERPLWVHHWNPYVLHQALEPVFRVGETCERQGSFGWYPAEDWGADGQVRWTREAAQAVLRTGVADPEVTVCVSAGPDSLAWPRPLQVRVRSAGSGPWMAATVLVPPGGFRDLRLRGCRASAGDLIEVRLDAAPFRPALLPEALPDTRALGVAVREIAAVAGGDGPALVLHAEPPPQAVD